MIGLLFANRKEIVGTEIISEGKSLSIAKLKNVGGYNKATFRDAIKTVRKKLKEFSANSFKVEILNTSKNKGLYQMIFTNRE